MRLPISKIESSEYADLNKVIDWFIALRWIAAVGVILTLIWAQRALSLDLHYPMLYALSSLLFSLNLAFAFYFYVLKNENLSRRELSLFFNVQICCDFLVLFFLVYFSGFLNNPFLYFFIFHIMMASYIFPNSVVIIYVSALIVFVIAATIGVYFQWIPDYSYLSKEVLFPRLIGFCLTLGIAAYLDMSIKGRITEAGKKVAFELNRYKNLDQEKSNFILQVTHELRGPLAALKGYLDIVLKGISGPISDQTADHLTKAKTRTANLLNMIDEMIDYAYMRTKSKATEKKTHNRLKDIIDDNIDYFEHQAQGKNIKLVSSCPEDLSVNVNRDLLNIILSNLITNALKYSPPETNVLINAEHDEKQIHIAVKDEGIGIEPDDMENIFEEFFRTPKARETEKDGTGLGLSIVKRAVNSLNGKIMVYSEPGKGSTFHLYFSKDALT